MKPHEMFLLDEEKLFTRLANSASDLDIHSVLRLLHTVKGNANAFGFKQVAVFTHIFESFLEKYTLYDKDQFTAEDKKIIIDSALAMSDAIVLLRGDNNANLNFKDLAKRMTCVLKEKSLDKRTSEAPVGEVFAIDDEEKPSIKEKHVLHISVGGQKCTIPIQTIVEVIYRPDIIPVTGSFLTTIESSGDIAHAKLVRFRGRLMPLLSPEALLDTSTVAAAQSPIIFSASRITIPWAVILRDPRGGQYRDTWFCLPVDDVLTVTHAATLNDSEQTASLNFDRIRDTVNKLRPAA